MVGDSRERPGHLVSLLRGRSGQQPLSVADEIVDPVGTERTAEVLRRDVLELMCLVDHEGWRERDHLAIGTLPHGRVRAEQVVIDDDDVGFGRTLAHAGHEAVVVARAVGAQARVRLGGDVAPERQVLRQFAQFRAVARLGALRPGVNDWEENAIARVNQSSRCGCAPLDPIAIELPAVETQVVRPAFHQRGGERDAERILQRGEVLEEDLLLEILGAGGDEDAVPAEDGGDQIGEGLSVPVPASASSVPPASTSAATASAMRRCPSRGS